MYNIITANNCVRLPRFRWHKVTTVHETPEGKKVYTKVEQVHALPDRLARTKRTPKRLARHLRGA